MKFFDYGFKRLKSRVPIWFAQIKTVIAREGIFGLVGKVYTKVYRYIFFSGDPHRIHKAQYGDWMKNVESKYLNSEAMQALNKKVDHKIKFSVILPTWNKSEEMYEKAFGSVINQVYDNWELCVSDGSSKNIEETKAYLDDLKKKIGNKMKLRYLSDDLRDKINIVENANNCIEQATGDYLVFMDCDDEISPNCLLELADAIQQNPKVDFIYSDFDKIDTAGIRFDPSFWPDWSPHTLLSQMYVTHVTCYRTKLVKQLGLLRKGTEGAQDWDLILRASEKTKNIVHIPKILYHWKVYPGSTALSSSGAKNWAYENQKKVLQDWLSRNKIKGEVVNGFYEGSLRVKFSIIDNPKVSIIIPFRDKIDYVKRCVKSILDLTDYDNYEILLINNQSAEPESLKYIEEIKKNDRVQVLDFDHPFHFGKINNWAAEQSDAEHILLLNNDTKVINKEWLSAMLEFSQRPEVGAVGAKLLYPDGKIQHAGIIVGMGGAAAHGHRLLPGDQFGYNGWLVNVRDVIGVTGACFMIKRDLFLKLGGFDITYDPGYQDVDICLRLHEKGYWNIFTPYAQLFHYESVTRFAKENKAKLKKDEDMAILLRKRWSKYLGINFGNDPFYNPNLSYDHEDFRMRTV